MMWPIISSANHWCQPRRLHILRFEADIYMTCAFLNSSWQRDESTITMPIAEGAKLSYSNFPPSRSLPLRRTRILTNNVFWSALMVINPVPTSSVILRFPTWSIVHTLVNATFYTNVSIAYHKSIVPNMLYANSIDLVWSKLSRKMTQFKPPTSSLPNPFPKCLQTWYV